MQIGYFVQGEGIHLDMAKHLIASVKKAMPDVDVFQLTDGVTPCQDGARAIRLHDDVPMAVRRMALHASLPGEWLFVDTDVVFQKDVRDVFDSPFDIAVTDRVGSAWEHSPDVKHMPYNMGVTFSRNPKFWERAKEILLTLPSELQAWVGDQLVVCELQKQFRTKVLPGHIYNFTPWERTDDRSHAAIVHYKGQRKSWLCDLKT
jgi:hypothetical protein